MAFTAGPMTVAAQTINGDGSEHPYRPTKELPYELAQHCSIYFEEKLYRLGLTLLLDLLTSGTLAGPGLTPTFVPSPAHLALASTIVVHPAITTRARSRDDAKAADIALELLRSTKRVVGVLNARFAEAFTITHFESSRRQSCYADDTESKATQANHGPDLSNIAMARNESVWSRAEDFWQAVGWAFNCSVLYPKRWERWQFWLEFVCDVLEDDWQARLRQAEATDLSEGSVQFRNAMKESLIFKYISSTSALSDKKRRILRAVFANGQSESMLFFKEIFRDELKEPKKKSPKNQQTELNLEENIFEDYDLLEDEDEDDDEDAQDSLNHTKGASLHRSKRNKRNTLSTSLSTISDTINDEQVPQAPIEEISGLGPLSAIHLRQRLLQLLANVTACLPKDFIDVDQLYHLFVESVHHLPFPTFHLLLSSPILDGLLDVSRMTLCERLLCSLLENGGFSDTYMSQEDDEGVSQYKLEECYLPFSARTRNKNIVHGGRNAGGSNAAIDNAKVSVLLEAMLRLLAERDMLQPSAELTSAVEKGIAARLEGARLDTRRNSNTRQGLDGLGLIWLTESNERLRFMLKMLSVTQ
ncbi:hypothetical protein KEM56_004548 [Ascosphaera pollenicola]|nr:hypothetical protein KEM56_004548 [Ascosphaera pollenicola]